MVRTVPISPRLLPLFSELQILIYLIRSTLGFNFPDEYATGQVDRTRYLIDIVFLFE